MKKDVKKEINIAIGKRIEALLLVKNGGNQSELARYCNVSPQAVQQWLAGETSPRDATMRKAAEFFGVPPAAIQFGEPTPKQREGTGVIGEFRLESAAPPKHAPTTKSRVIDKGSISEIPLISGSIRPADLSGLFDPYEAGGVPTIEKWLPTDLPLSEQSFAMIVHDASMSPEYSTGDIVYVDPEVDPRPGQYVVATLGDSEITFRQYRQKGRTGEGKMVFELVPLNPSFPVSRSDIEDIIIVGTVRFATKAL